jgi:hypothetical protein
MVEPVVIGLPAFTTLWEAAYHQERYQKNPLPYRRYSHNSGRCWFIGKLLGNRPVS